MLRFSTNRDSRRSTFYLDILLALLLTAAIAWASDRGFFRPANGVLTDLFYTLMPTAVAPSNDILLVDATAEYCSRPSERAGRA